MVSRGFVLTIGVLFHLIYLRSIFDIYFKSPVVSVEEQFYATSTENAATEAPSERLFLIVGDGLRADKLFENPQLAPFLSQKALEEGRWGISHTRVPTESRPGHVALIAGLYEDVSAVTTGWTMNPINFDSAFNQSAKTYAWGSPDILPMFREGSTDKERVSCKMYDAEAEDFTQESHRLDTWVFDHVQELFSASKTNNTLSRQLKSPKTIFFLHLLGLDTAGHRHRPYSDEYLNNIALVDRGIAALTRTLKNTWGNEELAKTTFLFTADHGMSDWGSHGDGHPDNTRTPYIVWGAGIKSPTDRDIGSLSSSLLHHGTQSETLGWQVESKQRIDVAQADLSALMTYSIGVPFPKNNVGSLPIELLTAASKDAAIAIFQNARQIHAQYTAKALHKSKQLHFSSMIGFAFSHPYEELGFEHIKAQRWSDVEKLSEAWIVESIDGMKYFQRYDWFFLRSVVTMGYLGWMLFALIFVLNTYVLPYSAHGQAKAKEIRIQKLMGPKLERNPIDVSLLERENSMIVEEIVQPSRTSIAFVGLTVATVAYLLERSAPLSYYAYAAFPLFFWYRITREVPALIRSMKRFSNSSVISDARNFGIAVLGLFIIQSVVHAYADRRVLSILWPMASVTPMFYPSSNDKRYSVMWAGLCVLMSGFTSLPTVQAENITFVVLGGCIMCAVGVYFIMTRGGNFTMGAQVGLIALATIVTKESSTSLANKQGLPVVHQLLGWLTLISSLLLPLLHRLERRAEDRVTYQNRLMILFLTFAPTFVILSISYEGIFYLVFWALLVTWLHLESAISTSLEHDSKIGTISSDPTAVAYRGLQHSDARIALYFFFLIQAAFFGTGNIASVSSFSLDSVYRLIPIFNPFAMGSLLLFKLLVPFAVISANLGILNRKLQVAPSALFMTVLTFCDVVTLNFFWMVKDEGSWLEIGSSISAFVIGGMLILFVICLEQVSEWMVGDVSI